MGKQRKMDHEDGPYGGQFGGGGPEVYSEGWSQDPGWSDGLPWSYEYPPHMGKMVHTNQGEARSETGDLTLKHQAPYHDTDTGRTHHTATDQHGNVWHWSYVENDAEKDWEIAYRDTDGKVHEYYSLDDGTWAEDHALEKQDENLAKDHLPPPGIQEEDENLAKDRLPLPDPIEEPAPAPGIQGVENFAKGHLPGLVEEEPPTEQQPQAEPPVQPNPPAEPPVEQSPTPNPPAVPGGGEGGIPGMGIPYQDFIPFYPMDQDPATGEWGNAQPEEIPKPDQQPEGNAPTQLDPNLLDPIAPGPTLDTGLVERIEQSPGLVDKVNQDPAVAEALERDPAQIDQIEQYLGVAEQRPTEPSGGTDLGGATDPSLTDAGSTAGQDGHDHDDGVFEGI